MEKSERPSQQERSLRTVEKLRAAALELMAEVGFLNTTTVNISNRAGVSRGALLHHYANKTDLVIDATNDMWLKSVSATTKYCDALSKRQIGVAAFIEGLWEEAFHLTNVSVMIDLMSAARGDEKLARHLDDNAQRFFSVYDKAAAVLFANTGMSAEEGRAMMSVATALIRGLRIQEMLRPTPEVARMARAILRSLLEEALARKADAGAEPKALQAASGCCLK